MNADARQPHSDSSHDPKRNLDLDVQTEARLVALVLGEASDFEREELDRLLNERPELMAFVDEMRSVHGLLQSAGSGELAAPDDEWKLAPKCREHLFAVFSGEVAADKANAPGQHVVSQAPKPRGSWPRRWLAGVTAAAAVVLLAVYLGTGPRQAELTDRRSETANKWDFGVVVTPQSSEGQPLYPKPEVWRELARDREKYAEVELIGPQSGPRHESEGFDTHGTAASNRRLRSAQLFVGPELSSTENGVSVPKIKIEMRPMPSIVKSLPRAIRSDAPPITTWEYTPKKRSGALSEILSRSLEEDETSPSGQSDSNGLEIIHDSDRQSELDKDNLARRGSEMGGFGAGGPDGNGRSDINSDDSAPSITDSYAMPDDRLHSVPADENSGRIFDGPDPTKQPTADLNLDFNIVQEQVVAGARPTTEPQRASAEPQRSSAFAPGPEMKDRLTSKSSGDGDASQLPTFAFTTDGSKITVPDGGVVLGKEIIRLWNGQSQSQPTEKSADEPVRGRVELDAQSSKRTHLGHQTPTVLHEFHAGQNAFSTFSLNVSDVSFKLARTALAQGQWPDAANVRVEEFVNAFDYGDPLPGHNEKVASAMEQSIHPFLQQRNLLRVSMRTAATGRAANTPLRLTFVLDNSGSMERLDRQQTVRRAFRLMAKQLKPIDQATLITFARQPRLVADRVSGANAASLVQMIENLPSEGGTNIEAALELAFAKAREQQLAGAQNRIILLTDGAVNLGNADPESLASLIATIRDSGIAFDAAGICADELNDELLEALTRYGDGRYYLLDSAADTDDGFARQIAGALQPSAMNVKVQVEFNPKRVGYYKLLGFEKHRLNTEDFRDDQVDAAEMTAAEAGVAMYQFEPKPDGVGDVGSVAVRFLDPSTGQMVENRWPIPYQPEAPRPEQASPSLRVATSAALLAVKLRGEPLGEVVELPTLAGLLAGLPDPARKETRVQELEQMIEQARRIAEK